MIEDRLRKASKTTDSAVELDLDGLSLFFQNCGDFFVLEATSWRGSSTASYIPVETAAEDVIALVPFSLMERDGFGKELVALARVPLTTSFLEKEIRMFVKNFFGTLLR